MTIREEFNTFKTVNIWWIAGEISFIILIIFFLMFSLCSLLEKEKKAFFRSSLFFLSLLLLNFSFFHAGVPIKNWLFGSFFILFVLGLFLLLFSRLRRKSIEITGEKKKIDERDIIFARFDYKEGTNVFREYYARRPEYKKIDDEIRKMPDILTPYHIKKNPLPFSLARAEFDFLEHQLTQVSGEECAEKVPLSASENTRVIKKIIRYLGSDLCGICLLNQSYVYSHVGRGPEPYGKMIEPKHRYAIVFVVEMVLEMVAAAPQAPVIVETAKKYVEAAKISIIAANFIRRLGYPARAHVAGSNYQAMLPPLAWEAGLGELGRLGILITPKFGPRVRLGLITTDLPLITDKSKLFGIQNFCQKCQKCATNCPVNAIPPGEKSEETGTDCTICVYVCPYSKPDNAFHKLIRRATEKSSAFQSLSIWGDDFFYGRIPLRRKRFLGI